MGFDVISKLNGSVTVTESSAPATIRDIGFGNSIILTHIPASGTSAAIAAGMFSEVIADTTGGNFSGTSHDIAYFAYLRAIGGGSVSQMFGLEYRMGGAGSTAVTDFVCAKYVFDIDADVGSMTATNVVLREISDQSATATWMTNILDRILDPRHVMITKGGINVSPIFKTDDYTAKEQDSGKLIVITAGTGKTLTIPAALTDGWSCKLKQGGAGQVTAAGSGGLTLANKEGHSKTEKVEAVVFVDKESATEGALHGETGA